jgi:hypothetical protein
MALMLVAFEPLEFFLGEDLDGRVACLLVGVASALDTDLVVGCVSGTISTGLFHLKDINA